MGKFALILAALTAVALSTGQVLLSDSQLNEADTRSKHGSEILARQAAQTGHAEAVHVLRSGANPRTHGPVTGSVGGATYEATYEVVSEAPLSVRVRSAGRYGAKRHVVDALLRDENGDPPETAAEALRGVPPYLRYAVFSNDDIRFAALPQVASGDSSLNANIHANGDLNLLLSLDAILGLRPIAGFGTYAGRFRGLTLFGTPANLFRPFSNPDDVATLRRTAPVAMEPFDPDDAAGEEAERQRGELRLLGSVELGTREAPRVIHVEGDLILVDVQMEGYGTFVVDGSVIIESSVTGLLQTLVGRPESRVAVYADGPIVFNGLGEVEGQFVSNSSVTFAGAATLHGSIAAMGPVSFLIAPTVRFVSPSPALTIGLPGNPPPRPLTLAATREWEVLE